MIDKISNFCEKVRFFLDFEDIVMICFEIPTNCEQNTYSSLTVMLIPRNYDKHLCSLMGGPYEWLSDIWDTKECSLFTLWRCSLMGGRYQC